MWRFVALLLTHSLLMQVKAVDGVIVSGPETVIPVVETAVRKALNEAHTSKVPIHLTPGHSKRRDSLEVAASNLKPLLNQQGRAKVVQRVRPMQATPMSMANLFAQEVDRVDVHGKEPSGWVQQARFVWWGLF